MLRPAVTTLLAFLLSLAACSPAAKPAKKAEAQSAAWKCPDTGLKWFTQADGKAWTPPERLNQDPKGMPPILPGLLLKDSAGDKEITEPNLAWIGDLNGDAKNDLVMRDGVGEAKPVMVLVNCGGDRYLTAYETAADGIAVEGDTAPADRWKLMKVHAIPFGLEREENVVLRWDGQAYRPCNRYSVSIDSLNAPHPMACP